MAISLIGFGGTIADVDGTQQRALRIAARPSEALGHFTFGGFTGILPAALGANSELFQFRNAATTLVNIRRVRITAAVSTTFFTAGVPVQIDMVKATGWSAQGTLGTGITPAGMLKKRTSLANTIIASGDIRIATTAALGAGTKTLETLSIRSTMASGPTTGSMTIIAPGFSLFEANISGGAYPLTLAQNEGFVVRSVAVPATGTWMASIGVEWMEMAAY